MWRLQLAGANVRHGDFQRQWSVRGARGDWQVEGKLGAARAWCASAWLRVRLASQARRLRPSGHTWENAALGKRNDLPEGPLDVYECFEHLIGQNLGPGETGSPKPLPSRCPVFR